MANQSDAVHLAIDEQRTAQEAVRKKLKELQNKLHEKQVAVAGSSATLNTIQVSILRLTRLTFLLTFLLKSMLPFDTCVISAHAEDTIWISSGAANRQAVFIAASCSRLGRIRL